MTSSPDLHRTILNQLGNMPLARRYWVAYSAGMDSHTLLSAMARVRDQLPDARVGAIHVNHGLQPEADSWARHAEAVCHGLGIACRVLIADARAAPGQSQEAAARRARYGVMEAIVGSGEILLVAHHRDDQAETLLLQMIRGAGPRGLAAMPRLARFGAGWLARPLLDVPRAAIREYAKSQGLVWIEDKSNDDPRFDRNYLRHEILPRLQTRWPTISRTLGRVAAHQADMARQLDLLAREDLENLRGSEGDTLSCHGLRRLPEYRQRNALHAWFRRLGLPAPNAVHLQRILADVLGAGPDRKPRVCWQGAQVRRYRDNLYAGAPLSRHDPGQVILWSLDGSLRLSHGRLEARRAVGAGLRAAACSGNKVEVRFRQGGERCRIAANAHTRLLKRLFQERGIVPWERDRTPLVFVEGQLAAVAGLWVCAPFEANGNEQGWVLQWSKERYG
ncbi:MAG: tRNA(Ile)-lysidine synthase [Candidatus Kentron sp. G]|nr:MAG: tRNA(Ile)-lysidine synthase [Candidatus Kentron sp. G]VFN00399.1 MAG: tRNA(Ile)-lysidine synthase [Candidatus Kentron sp. G]VFN02960.1 MAG: tRNA(Ile)-lysidine synthase [Candidatus Kentron sp. G]